jgi:pyrroloquinoline quinone (PQQ) biosynthesis protein C
MTERMMERIEQLLGNINKHPAVDNDFYTAWMSRYFGMEELEVVARNYGAWVRSFPDALAILVAGSTDVDAKTEYVKTLYSEMGYGKAEKAHSVLLDSFFEQLAKQLGFEARLDRARLESQVPLLASTTALIEGEHALYSDPQRSIGAQLALEWQAYTMVRKLYEGARNYMRFWPDPDGFHEACEYFYAHIGAAEKDHKEESLNAARHFAASEQGVRNMIDGYDRHLGLIASFWEGVYQAATRARAGTPGAAVAHN